MSKKRLVTPICRCISSFRRFFSLYRRVPRIRNKLSLMDKCSEQDCRLCPIVSATIIIYLKWLLSTLLSIIFSQTQLDRWMWTCGLQLYPKWGYKLVFTAAPWFETRPVPILIISFCHKLHHRFAVHHATRDGDHMVNRIFRNGFYEILLGKNEMIQFYVFLESIAVFYLFHILTINDELKKYGFFVN
jgi:hypothetical protein